MASRGEGFGLPLIEAATHGRPVLARDLPVFREQRLPNAYFFSDEAPAALGECLLQLLTAKSTTEQLGLPEWRHCVEGLLSELGIETISSHRVEAELRKAS